MKKIMALVVVLTLFIGQLRSQLQRIPLKSSDMYPNTSQPLTGLEYLTDDNPNTIFNDWNPLFKPIRITYDLSDYQPCVIKQLRYFFYTGNPMQTKFKYVRKSDGQEVTFLTYTGGIWQPYEKTFDIAVPEEATAFIIETNNGGDFPNYFQLWGSFADNPLPSAPIVHYPIRNFLMANDHVYDIDSSWVHSEWWSPKYKALSESGLTGFRIYNDILFNKDDAGNYAFNPTYQGGFIPDPFLARIRNDIPGFVRHVCWQGPSRKIKATWDAVGKGTNLDVPYGADRNNPLSWQELGQDAYVLANRYGKTSGLPDYPLYVPAEWYVPRQVMKKGTGLYDWFEPWNEDNAWWNSETCLDVHQMYTSMSVFYDGYKGLIPKAGVKTADPSAIVSSGGVASSDDWILHEGRYWSIKNRGYRPDGKINFPFDLYQFHAYPSGGGQYSSSNGGLPMELSVVPWAKKVVNCANKYADGMKCVIGEVGYDIHPLSSINAPAFSIYTAEQSRGLLAVRGVFKFSQIGLYASEWYRLFQDGSYQDANQTQFATMALLWQSDDLVSFKRRTIADYFKQLQPFLDYTFSQAVVDNDSVQVLKFSKQDLPDMYAMWTIENVVIDQASNRPLFTERTYNYSPPIGYGTLYSLNDDSSGVFKNQLYNGGFVQLRSKPVFILATSFVPLPVKIISFTAEKFDKNVLLKYSVNDAVKVDVERSTDGTNFSYIGTGSLTSFIDDRPSSGRNYYRIRVYDAQGKFVYSNIVSVIIKGSNKPVRAVMYDVSGREIRVGTLDDVDRWKSELKTSGVYLIKYIPQDTNTYIERYIKK
jgi:hypothetical protein